MKSFVKTTKYELGFPYLKQKFPKISDVEIFGGFQINKLMRDEKFEGRLNDLEKSAWVSFKNAVKYFLGNKNSDNSRDQVNQLLKAYEDLRCNMCLKIHFLHPNLISFPKTWGS